MGEAVGHRPQLVADQPVLQRAQPGLGDQRLGQMLVHLAVPFRQQDQRLLPQPLGRALGRRLAGEPQIRPDQRQQAARRRVHRIQLRLDEAFAGMHLARLHQRQPALDALRVAPVKADMLREGPVHRLVVGVAQKARGRVHEARVVVIGQHALKPAVRVRPQARASGPCDGCAASRAGIAPIICSAMPVRRRPASGSAPGATTSRPASIAAATDPACISRIAAVIEVSAPDSAVQCSAATWPGGRDRGQIVMRCPAGSARSATSAGSASPASASLTVMIDWRLSKRAPAVGRPVFLGVVRVQLLDHHVLIVEIGRGQPPAQLLRPPDQHQRHARDRAADHPARSAVPAAPDTRSSAPSAPDAGHWPAGCRPPPTAPAPPPRRSTPPPCPASATGDSGPSRQSPAAAMPRRHPRHQAGIVGQGGHALARIVRQDVRQPLGRQQQRHPRPQHLGLQLSRTAAAPSASGSRCESAGAQAAISVENRKNSGAPRPRAPALTSLDPGVHPGRIGLQRASASAASCASTDCSASP